MSDMDTLEKIREEVGDLIVAEEPASKSWYKTGTPDIPVVSEIKEIAPLSKHSSVIANLKANNQVQVYAKPEDAEKARDKINEVLRKK